MARVRDVATILPIRRGPEWLRPAVGGLGLVLLVLPEMYGVGYPVLESAKRRPTLLPKLSGSYRTSSK